MIELLISALLALIPLLFIAYMLVSGTVFTVGGLFMSLILLTISGIFGLNVLLTLRRKYLARASASQPAKAMKAAAAAAGVPALAAAPAAGEVRAESGLVVKLEYYEAPVGQPSKSLVTFQPNGGGAHVIVLEGDLRSVLPAGKRVKIAYTAGEAGSRLVSAE